MISSCGCHIPTPTPFASPLRRFIRGWSIVKPTKIPLESYTTYRVARRRQLSAASSRYREIKATKNNRASLEGHISPSKMKAGETEGSRSTRSTRSNDIEGIGMRYFRTKNNKGHCE